MEHLNSNTDWERVTTAEEVEQYIAAGICPDCGATLEGGHCLSCPACGFSTCNL